MRVVSVVLLVIAGLLLVPAAALAAPPSLLSVGQTGRHLTATWSMPAGVESRVIEVATSPNTGSDGYFFDENVVLFDTLESAQTSYLSTSQINAGLYYVHVAGYDANCLPCPIREWSNVLTVTVPADPPPLPPPPPPDTTKPFMVVGGPSAQRVGGLYVTAQMTEAGTLTARATVNVPRAPRVYRFKTVARTVGANVPTRLRLGLARSARRIVTSSLRRGRALRVRLSVTATDEAGNSTIQNRIVRLKPPPN